MLDGAAKSPQYGYNAATDTFEDLMEAGIIDPTKVIGWYMLDILRLGDRGRSCVRGVWGGMGWRPRGGRHD